jgi:uncharacterized membrane protein YdbT with pleckstrin-like domain
MEVNEVQYKKSKFRGNHEVFYQCPKCGSTLTTLVKDIKNGDRCPDCFASFNFSRKAKLMAREQILSVQNKEDEALKKAESKEKQRKQQAGEKKKKKLAHQHADEERVGQYTKESLGPDEKVVYTGKLHWKIFVQPIGYIIFGIIFASLGYWLVITFGQKEIVGHIGGDLVVQTYKFADVWWPAPILIGAAFIIGGFFGFLGALLRRWTSEFAVTSRKVIAKQGLFARHTLELKLAKIDSLSIQQTILDRLLGSGSVILTVATEKQYLHCLSDPMVFKKSVEKILPD